MDDITESFFFFFRGKREGGTLNPYNLPLDSQMKSPLNLPLDSQIKYVWYTEYE